MWNNCIFSSLELHECVNDIIDKACVFKLFPNLQNNKVFNPVLFYCFFSASAVSFCVGTLVVMVNRTASACAAFTDHQGFTFAAKQLCSQEIIVFRFVTGGSFFVFCNFHLYTVKQILGNQRGDPVRNYDVADLYSPMYFRLESIRETLSMSISPPRLFLSPC